MNAQLVEEVTHSPQRRLWSADEFERAGELGLFGPEERLELIEGEVISKVAPQLTPHTTAFSLTEASLRGLIPTTYYLRTQSPLNLGPNSRPEPDIAVVPGGPRNYMASHPTTAALIVEIADSSLKLDRHAKASLYARSAVPEYWIVNILDRVLEVHREPIAMEDQPYGFHYRSITRHSPSDKVSPLIAPEHAILVSDILP